MSRKHNVILYNICPTTLREKCPNKEFFLAHIFLYSDQKNFANTFHIVLKNSKFYRAALKNIIT